jgi:hypothetical protein
MVTSPTVQFINRGDERTFLEACLQRPTRQQVRGTFSVLPRASPLPHPGSSLDRVELRAHSPKDPFAVPLQVAPMTVSQPADPQWSVQAEELTSATLKSLEDDHRAVVAHRDESLV